MLAMEILGPQTSSGVTYKEMVENHSLSITDQMSIRSLGGAFSKRLPVHRLWLCGHDHMVKREGSYHQAMEGSTTSCPVLDLPKALIFIGYFTESVADMHERIVRLPQN